MKKFDVYYGHYGDTERLNDKAFETRADAEDFIREWIAMTWTDHPTRADEYEIRERRTYKIDYNTGAGNRSISGTLEQAMALADEYAAYTQRDITIKDEAGHMVARRSWWGEVFDPDITEDIDPIEFGDFGHYSDWETFTPDEYED